MIARLTGIVVEQEERALIIDVQGVGYRVQVLPDTLKKSSLNATSTLKIYHHRSEDSETLYGFETDELARTFTVLLTVPSVGVKTAMNILEAASPELLAQAVSENDMTLLTKISGVGKKTAQRLLIELKEKIAKPKKRTQLSGSLQQETVEALISIGYTLAQARAAVEVLPPTVTKVEDAVRLVLQAKRL